MANAIAAATESPDKGRETRTFMTMLHIVSVPRWGAQQLLMT